VKIKKKKKKKEKKKEPLGQSKHFESGECLQAPVSLWFSEKFRFCLYQP
jgi:hypothetical protein